MITAVDTNILLDILVPDSVHAEPSERALTEGVGAGALMISEPVYAELAARFPTREALDHFLADTGIRLQPSGAEALHQAGKAWQEYHARRPGQLSCPACGASRPIQCERCGRSITPRQHVLADFIIGAHALVHADRLLTRDRGYYKTYFPRLELAP